MRIPLTHYLQLLLVYLRPQGAKVLLLTVLLFSSIGLQLLSPRILSTFIDTISTTSDSMQLSWLAIAFLGVAFLTQIVTAAASYVGEDVGWTSTNRLRQDLASHSLQLDMSFYTRHTPGELIERIDGDVTALANFFSQLVLRVLGNGLLLTGLLVVLFYEDWRVGAAMSLFVVIAIGVLGRIRNLALPHWIATRQASAALFGYIEEHLAGTEDIRPNGARDYVLRRLYDYLHEKLVKERRANLMVATSWTTTIVLFTVGTATALALGAYLFQIQAITLGTVYLIYAYTEMLRTPLERIMRQVDELQRAGASIQRVQDLFNTTSRIIDGKTGQLPLGPIGIAFQDVDFEYDNGQPVLHHISFDVPEGGILGILGRTGSGKTSIARLLFRLYDPTGGTVLIGGTDIRTIPLSDLRSQIGLVTQDVQLFNTSVRYNLTFFDQTIPDEKIMASIHTLGLIPWYEGLPHGLDTELSGSMVSAGEAQLLALVRIFLQNPRIVVLDEASSRLDVASEQQITSGIRALLKGRTGVVIAHRLSTMSLADDVMILENGSIIEHGRRSELQQNPQSRLYQLFRAGVSEVVV